MDIINMILGTIGSFFAGIGSFILGITVVILLALLFMKCYKKVPPDKVLVVSGKFVKNKFVTGGGAQLVIPFVQRTDILELGIITTRLAASGIETGDIIGVDVQAVATFRISCKPELIEDAAQNYLNRSKSDIEADVNDILLGKTREIVGKMKIIDMIQRQDELSAAVTESSHEDMRALGLELVTFNIQKIQDQEGVIDNMGADQSNEIRKAAALAKIKADQEVAERQNELDLRVAALKKESDKAKAEADLVYETEKATRERELMIAQENAKIATEERRIELAERAVEVKERELEASVKKQAEADRYQAEQQAEADLFRKVKAAEAMKATAEAEAEAELFTQEQDAKGVIAKAEADAKAIRAKALAEAEAVKAKGEAEGEAEKAIGVGKAEAVKQQIAAYNVMVGNGFLTSQYIDVLPELAQAVAEPLGNVDSITMYGEGNAAKLVEDVTKAASQVNAGLGDALGIDLGSIVSGLVTGTAAGRAAKGVEGSCEALTAEEYVNNKFAEADALFKFEDNGESDK